MQKIINRGFTLIELLVVIAIIGILAAIVLVSLGNARQKGADAGIQGNLGSIRTQMEVYAGDNNSSYDAGCNNSTVNAALNAARSASGALAVAKDAAGAANTVTCNDGSSAWGVESPIKSVSGQFWCVDSTGKAATTTGTSFTGATDYTCQ